MSSSPQRRMRKVAEKRAVRELKDTEVRDIANRRAPIDSVGHVQDMVAIAITQAMAHHLEHWHRPWWRRLARYVRNRIRERQFQRLRETNAEAYDG